MSIWKQQHNKKWVATDEYKENYDKIFNKKNMKKKGKKKC